MIIIGRTYVKKSNGLRFIVQNHTLGLVYFREEHYMNIKEMDEEDFLEKFDLVEEPEK